MAGRQSRIVEKYSVNVYRLSPGTFQGMEQQVRNTSETETANYLYCCTVHLVDSLIITQPTNALIVCHLF